MTNPYITAALADQHSRQLLRDASRHNLAQAARRPRSARRAPNRPLALRSLLQWVAGAAA
jgi:hypothetical protein